MVIGKIVGISVNVSNYSFLSSIMLYQFTYGHITSHNDSSKYKDSADCALNIFL